MERPEDERWEQADAILDQLLDLPAASRGEALDRMDLEAELEACVWQLLRAHDSAGLLDRPTGSRPAPAVDLVGRRVGDWTLQRELGRGGMSVVWLGCRGEGARLQQAAIKLLPIGVLARRELVRFHREQAILSRLNHPHIAHLYEAGEADDGTPYLAMERVDGARIDAWCDHRRLDVHARVRLMLDVCAAIAYTHRNLVVHADLKPSNVLVDEEGHVRVLDFGIGRLLDERRSEPTRTRWRAVTPEYAAPEQLAGAPVSTAADVFGLGALLYRLLTGRAPRERVDDRECTAPSRALLRDRDAAQAAQQRSRSRLVRGDLDAIVLKALEAEPEQRYLSVEALASDLHAWLAQLPISARAPSRRYWIGKFVRRHRFAVVATAAVLVAVVAGVSTTLWQAHVARMNAAAARLQAQRAVAVKDVLLKLLQRTHPGVIAGDPPASQLLREGSEDIRKDATLEPEVRVELLRVIGRSQGGRGWYGDARDSLAAALALYRAGKLHDPVGQAETLQRLAWVKLDMNDADGGIAMMRKADALLGGSSAAFTPLHDNVRSGLVDMLVFIGRSAEARSIALDLLPRMRKQGRSKTITYAHVLRSLGAAEDVDHHPAKAIGWLQQSEQVLDLDPRKNAPGLATIHNELGLANWHAGRLDRAEQAFRKALDGYVEMYGRGHPNTLIVRRHLAAVRMDQGHVSAAVAELQAIRKQLIVVRGDSPGRDLARTDYWLAVGHYRQGHVAKALTEARTAWHMALKQDPGFRRQHDTMAPLLGLLEFETGGGKGGDLLDQDAQVCGSTWPPAALRRWICIARTLHADGQGSCIVPGKTVLPPASRMDGIDRRWQAAYHLVRADCGSPESRPAELREARALEHGAVPAFPSWLRSRLAREVAAR